MRPAAGRRSRRGEDARRGRARAPRRRRARPGLRPPRPSAARPPCGADPRAGRRSWRQRAERRLRAGASRRGRRDVGKAAADERLDADRRGPARPRLPRRRRQVGADPRPHGEPARAPRRGAGAAARLHARASGPRTPSATSPMLEPEVETRPWAEQLALDDASYRSQLAYLLERSPFYREKLAGLRDRRRARRDRAAAAHGEGRAAADAHAREPVRDSPLRGAARARPDLLDERHDRARRATSRSRPATSTTGSPAPPAATQRRGSASGQRIVSTYNAGPFVAGAALAAFDRIGLYPHPGRHREHGPARPGDRGAAAGSRRADTVLRGLPRREPRSSELERRARARRGRARRRRACFPREAGGGLGRAGDRGDGHRRHRHLALGRVRGAGRNAPRRARVRPSRADRSGDRRGARAGGRRDRRARADAPPPPRRAAPALPHARPRRGADEPVHVRPHRPARAVHRPDRRHADRPRRQRLPCRDPRSRERVRARRERADPRSAGDSRASSRSRRFRSASSWRRRRQATPSLAEAIAERLREALLVRTTIELVPPGSLERSEYKSRLVERLS